MEKPPKEAVITYEERVARVVWEAHILSYLASKRSHAEPHQHDVDTEEFEDCGTDYGTDETVVLQARTSLFAKSSWTASFSCCRQKDGMASPQRHYVNGKTLSN